MVKNKRDLKSPRRKSLLPRPHVRKPSSSSSGNSNIKVIVRVRPPSEKEAGTNGRMIAKIINDQLLIFDPEEEDQPFFYHGVQQKGRDLLKKPKKNMQFLFDRVFGFEANNNDVFEESTKQLIDKLMEGCNCSVFVYGATGAGKTHTMLGCTENPGITLLTMKKLFEQKEALAEEREFELAVTYLEVYNENVQDLLNPGTPLHLREDGKFGVIVAGIKMKMITSSEELFELLEQGNRNRTQHPTDANAESSRSHAVFQVYLRMTMKMTRQVRMAKLSMIDLAGSERGAATGCVGQRFKEGSNINKSLLALGNCINSLAGGRGHVPYRDSKLTRLLKDSLGGNCQTVMIANISPSSLTYEDTYNTLKYATRAMKIKSCARKNVVTKNVNVEQYVIMIDNLKAEIEQLNGKLQETESRPTVTTSNVNGEDKNRLLGLVDELRKLLDRLHQLEAGEYGLDLRKQINQDIDNRLGYLCTNNGERLKGHKRLEDTIIRITKTESSLKDEIYHTKEKKNELFKKIDQMLEDAPELKTIGDVEKAKLKQLEAHYKAELLQKKHEKASLQLCYHRDLTQKMSAALQTCYLEFKGQNNIPQSVEKAYRSFVNEWQGIRTDSFKLPESDVFPDDNRKRKLSENESSCSLDSTYSMSSNSRPPLPVCAKQLLSKVNSTPSKVAKVLPMKGFRGAKPAGQLQSRRLPSTRK